MIDKAKELEMIEYLLEEIKDEIKYKNEFEKEFKKAKEKAKRVGDNYYWRYMDSKFTHIPRKSIAKSNAKMIRRLALKLYND